jgi:5'-nucleotidase
MKRRKFIKDISLGTGLLMTGGFPLNAAVDDQQITKITILHTNDFHSRIDPFPMDGSRNAGAGGAAKKAALIKKIRSEEGHVYLFDSGDIFQGTPYFNFYGGELEMKLMSEMKYDAATMGNHDFDAGLEGFLQQLPHAEFPFICSNYNFEDSILNGKTIPHKIFTKGDIRIGVFGLGIALEGLVPKVLYGNTIYEDPVSTANKTAHFLRHDKKCDYVICLSHLGYKYQNDKISDVILAAETTNINLILGGHTHTFMKQAEVLKNKNGEPIIINQAGWAGIMLGRLDLYFEKNKKSRCETCENLWVS